MSSVLFASLAFLILCYSRSKEIFRNRFQNCVDVLRHFDRYCWKAVVLGTLRHLSTLDGDILPTNIPIFPKPPTSTGPDRCICIFRTFSNYTMRYHYFQVGSTIDYQCHMLTNMLARKELLFNCKVVHSSILVASAAPRP